MRRNINVISKSGPINGSLARQTKIFCNYTTQTGALTPFRLAPGDCVLDLGWSGERGVEEGGGGGKIGNVFYIKN